MFSYRIIRSHRRTVSIQVTREGEVLVRCPVRMTDSQTRAFVLSKSDWVEAHLEKLAASAKLPPFTGEELRGLTERAKQVIPQRAAHFASLMGVTYGRVTIRHQRTRWGSCSARGDLNFNCLLMLAPPEVLDYVVVHELCHRRELNHSPRFWALVSQILPDHPRHRAWLKENGASLISRLP